MNDIIGFMLEHELDVLSDLAQTIPQNGKLVELGSLFGRTAVHWAMQRSDIEILCIDDFVDNNWDDLQYPGKANRPLNHVHYNTYDIFLANTKTYPNISHIKCRCPEGINYTGGNIDLLFVDLGHWNPVDWGSIEIFIPYLPSGSIICGHDYMPDLFPDVLENVSRLEKIFDTKATVHPNTTLWSIRIPQ